ncbi:MAG: hypothetical protein ACLR43_08100 [Faecalibacillus faecis]
MGYHGKHAQKFAYQLLNQGLLHTITTDTHRCDGHRSLVYKKSLIYL